MIFQAGDSDEGRDFAAASADAIFSRHSTLEAGQAFYADVKGRLPRFGRTRGELLILPAATFVLGDTDAEAAEIAREVRRAQVSPQTALMFIEQLWNTELPGFDVDGPLPAFDPVVSDTLISKGRASVRQFAKDPVALAAEWRARAEAGNLSAREVVIEVTGRQSFIGSARDGRRRRSTSWSRPTPPTATSWSRTSPRAGWPRSSTRLSRCCRSAACSAPTTPAPRCATTSA